MRLHGTSRRLSAQSGKLALVCRHCTHLAPLLDTAERERSGLPVCSVRDVPTDADAKQSYCEHLARDRAAAP